MLHRLFDSERGVSALETALILPVLAAILYLLIEGASALITYSTLEEASSVAARQVLMTGEDSNIPELVESLLPDLDPADISTSVTYEDSGTTVTVEVTYDYQTALGGNPLDSSGSDSISLVARTSMPVP